MLGLLPERSGEQQTHREDKNIHSIRKERWGKRGEKWENEEGKRRTFCLQIQLATASAQEPVSHLLAQTLLVSPHPRLADSAHCFKGLPWTGLWHPNAPYCLSNQLPRQAWLSCSLKVNIYLSLLLCTDACLLRHSTFRLTKICSDSDHLSGEMTENKVWLINLRGIFQWSSSQGLGESLGPLWVLLSLKILSTELAGVNGFWTSSSENSPASCVQKQQCCVYSRAICSCVSSNSTPT